MRSYQKYQNHLNPDLNNSHLNTIILQLSIREGEILRDKKSGSPSHTVPIEWDINISVLRNPLLWFQLFIVSLLSSSFLLFLLVGLNLYENNWEDIPSSLLVFLSIGGGLFLALSLMAFLMFGRGIPTKYVLRDGYIEQHTLSRGKKAVGLLGLFALLSGKNAGYTATGASLLAQSREQIAVEWKEVFEVQIFPGRKEIQLHNEWRTIMQVVCPNDQFDKILQTIEKKAEKNHKTEKETEKKETPFAIKVILSLLTLVLGIFLFPRLPIHYIGIFTIATIVFAFFALWSSGFKKRVFAAILFLLPIIGVGLAFVVGEVDFSQSGAIYALIIELMILGFFLLLGLSILFKRIN